MRRDGWSRHGQPVPKRGGRLLKILLLVLAATTVAAGAVGLVHALVERRRDLGQRLTPPMLWSLSLLALTGVRPPLPRTLRLAVAGAVLLAAALVVLTQKGRPRAPQRAKPR